MKRVRKAAHEGYFFFLPLPFFVVFFLPLVVLRLAAIFRPFLKVAEDAILTNPLDNQTAKAA